jgi:hypothetical protein
VRILTKKVKKLNKKIILFRLEFYELDQSAKSILKKRCEILKFIFDEELTAKISADLKQVKVP